MDVLVIEEGSRKYRDWHGNNDWVFDKTIPPHVVIGRPRMQSPTGQGLGNQEHGIAIAGYANRSNVYWHFILSPEHRDPNVINRMGMAGAYVTDPIEQATINHWVERAVEVVREKAAAAHSIL